MIDILMICLILILLIAVLFYFRYRGIIFYNLILITTGVIYLVIICNILSLNFVSSGTDDNGMIPTELETKKVNVEKINENIEAKDVNLETENVNYTCGKELKKIDGRVIWVGDSRTVQLQNVLSWFPDITNGREDLFSCKGSMGYQYFVETCLPEVASMKQAGDTIVMNMGVNDLGNIEYYIEKMNELVNGEWSDCTVIYMTPNPVLDSVSLVQNYQIESFNNRLREGLDEKIIFMDSYSALLQTDFLNLEMDAEGVHYSSPYNGRYNTYEYIYNMVRDYEIEVGESCDIK